MSRVFDALKRAREEKPNIDVSEDRISISDGEIPSQTGESFERPSWNLRGEFPAPETSSSNGHSVAIPSDVPELHVKSRSWREKLKNVVFGWDVSRFKSHPIIALDKNSPVAEQYKILREQIKKLRADTGARCLSVTSPVKRDGKTMVAVNLAAAMALDYEGKVLLIDGDLRRPQVHRYFGIDSSPGLGDYLASSGNGNFLSYVRETFIPRLQIVLGGKPTTSSSELLANQKMSTLMEDLRFRFPEHQIILDTPPVLSTPDPLVLGRHVDGIVVVIRAGKTPRDYLTKAVQSLNSAKVVGIVLNGVDLRTSAKYYYYSNKNP